MALVLTLHKTEVLRIGEDVLIEVKKTDRGRIRVVIQAPKKIQIDRIKIDSQEYFNAGGKSATKTTNT
jgi:sRNA-binding carbon storage regulator CsrA